MKRIGERVAIYFLGIVSGLERYALQTHYEAMYGMKPGRERNRLIRSANRIEKGIERIDNWRSKLQS